MSGAPDPLYVRARGALLDALDALEPHLDAIVLVGAQAVYLHTSDTELAVAEYTTDADLAVAPGDLADSPLIADALTARGFTPRVHPGGWLSPDGIYLDVMVPEALAGPGHEARASAPTANARPDERRASRQRSSIASAAPSPRSTRATLVSERSGSQARPL